MEKMMKKVEKQFMAAIFTEVLPASLQQELEKRNYKIKIGKKYVKVSSSRFCIRISDSYEQPSEATIRFLEKYVYPEDVDKTSSEYLKLFRRAVLKSALLNPETMELVQHEEVDRDWGFVSTWLNTYVEYKIPLDDQSISGVIRAAKAFAGLE